MSVEQVKNAGLWERIEAFVNASLSDELTAFQLAEFEQLLCENPEAQDLYVKLVEMSVTLPHALGRVYCEAELMADRDVDNDESINSKAPLSYIDPIECFDVPPSPIPSFSLSACHHTIAYFSQIGPLSYLTAAVLLGIGILIGSFIRIQTHHSEQVVKRSGSLPSRQMTLPIEATTVGRITNLADCQGRQWSVASGQWLEIPNLKSEIISPKFSVGDRFVLSFGLMEITYNTGAKVILEGPCTYKIESAHGGYLAVGKLTAKVGKGAGTRGQELGKTLRKLDMPAPRSPGHWPLTPAPLFAVRTPTAIVTDFGTEFGVEVEESGMTRSHVFQGKVELRREKNRRGATIPGDAIILTAGESARVVWDRNRAVVIVRESRQPDRFVRQISRGERGERKGESDLAANHQSETINRSSPTPLYRLTDLGTLGGPESHANAINAAGQVVGDAMTASGAIHAFLYADGKMTDLGTLGKKQSWAHDINAAGQIVGATGDSWADTLAFLFSDGRMTGLGTLGGRGSRADGINVVGQIVGRSLNSNGVSRAFLYTHDQGMKSLGALGDQKTDSIARSINASGMVAGYSETENGPLHAFLYSPTEGMIDLGKLDGNPETAFRVNDAGQVVGLLSRHGVPHAFLYSRNLGIKDLGALGPTNNCMIDINNRGQIIGCFEETVHGVPRGRSFLYSDGKMIDLESLIEPTAGWTNLASLMINDAGQIVGFGMAPDGGTRAFLLNPTSDH